MMIRMVGGWMFLLAPAHPGSPKGPKTIVVRCVLCHLIAINASTLDSSCVPVSGCRSAERYPAGETSAWGLELRTSGRAARGGRCDRVLPASECDPSSLLCRWTCTDDPSPLASPRCPASIPCNSQPSNITNWTLPVYYNYSWYMLNLPTVKDFS